MNPDCVINNSYIPSRTISGNNVTIYGYNNSTAQEFAEKYNKNFVSLETLTFGQGDINQDGMTGISDVILLRRYLMNTAKFTKERWELADMNSDGIVNIYDLILLKKLILNS